MSIELIFNGGFDLEPNGKGWYGNFAIIEEGITPHSLPKCASLTIDHAYITQNLSQRGRLDYPDEGILTLWAINRGARPGRLFVEVIYKDSVPVEEQIVLDYFEISSASSEWQKIELELNKQYPLQRIVIFPSPSPISEGEAEILIDDVSIKGIQVGLLRAFFVTLGGILAGQGGFFWLKNKL